MAALLCIFLLQKTVQLLPSQLENIAPKLLLPCSGGEGIVTISNEGYLNRCSLSIKCSSEKTVHDVSLKELLELNIEKIKRDKEKVIETLKCNSCKHKEKCRGGCLCEIENGNENFCLLNIIGKTLKNKEATPVRRRIINNIICRRELILHYKIPYCVRNSPIWSFPLKERTE